MTAIVEQTRLYIGGEWVEPTGGRSVDVINPTTEEPIGRVDLAGASDMDRAVQAARAAFDSGPWAASTPAERAVTMTRAGELIAERAEAFTRTIILEVGSPLALAAWQPVAAKLYLDWHAAQAETFPWEEEREGIRGPMLVRRGPVGVVGAIVPWNFPLALSFPKLAPALLTGCSVILKPPTQTPLFGFLLAEAFEEAGLPPGVLNVVPAGREVGEQLVSHPLVDKISFTGSTSAGRRIGALCGEQIKRCSLELGGKSAAIVLPDADLDAVIPALAPNTMRNNGQTCTNATRVLAPRERHDEVVEALREQIGAYPVGDPADPDVAVGPLVSAVQRERVERYIAAGRDEGARLVLGGGRPDRDRGYFVEPTLFADVDNAMTIAQEEIFGPVVCVIPYDDEDHAVAIANDSALRALGQRVGAGRRARQGRRAPDPQRQRRGQPAHPRPRGPVRRLQAVGARARERHRGHRGVRRAPDHPLRAMRIQAAISASAEAPFEIAEVELDEPRRDELLVELRAVGVCHSDLTMKAVWPQAISPIVLGHEGAGVVMAVGDEVARRAPRRPRRAELPQLRRLPAVRGRAPAVLPRLPDAERDRLAARTAPPPCAATARGCTGRTSASRASRRTRSRMSRTWWWSARRSTSASPLRWAAACRPAPGPCSTCSRRRRTPRWSCSAPAASGCRPSWPPLRPASARSSPSIRSRAAGSSPRSSARPRIDPTGGDVIAEIRALTGTGATHAIDTTAKGAVINQAIEALAPLGTLALVGIHVPEFASTSRAS